MALYLAKSNINNKREQGRQPERGSVAAPPAQSTMRVIIYTLLSDSNYNCHLTLGSGGEGKGMPDKGWLWLVCCVATLYIFPFFLQLLDL